MLSFLTFYLKHKENISKEIKRLEDAKKELEIAETIKIKNENIKEIESSSTDQEDIKNRIKNLEQRIQKAIYDINNKGKTLSTETKFAGLMLIYDEVSFYAQTVTNQFLRTNSAEAAVREGVDKTKNYHGNKIKIKLSIYLNIYREVEQEITKNFAGGVADKLKPFFRIVAKMISAAWSHNLRKNQFLDKNQKTITNLQQKIHKQIETEHAELQKKDTTQISIQNAINNNLAIQNKLTNEGLQPCLEKIYQKYVFAVIPTYLENAWKDFCNSAQNIKAEPVLFILLQQNLKEKINQYSDFIATQTLSNGKTLQLDTDETILRSLMTKFPPNEQTIETAYAFQKTIKSEHSDNNTLVTLVTRDYLAILTEAKIEPANATDQNLMVINPNTIDSLTLCYEKIGHSLKDLNKEEQEKFIGLGIEFRDYQKGYIRNFYELTATASLPPFILDASARLSAFAYANFCTEKPKNTKSSQARTQNLYEQNIKIAELLNNFHQFCHSTLTAEYPNFKWDNLLRTLSLRILHSIMFDGSIKDNINTFNQAVAKYFETEKNNYFKNSISFVINQINDPNNNKYSDAEKLELNEAIKEIENLATNIFISDDELKTELNEITSNANSKFENDLMRVISNYNGYRKILQQEDAFKIESAIIVDQLKKTFVEIAALKRETQSEQLSREVNEKVIPGFLKELHHELEEQTENQQIQKKQQQAKQQLIQQYRKENNFPASTPQAIHQQLSQTETKTFNFSLDETTNTLKGNSNPNSNISNITVSSEAVEIEFDKSGSIEDQLRAFMQQSVDAGLKFNIYDFDTGGNPEVEAAWQKISTEFSDHVNNITVPGLADIAKSSEAKTIFNDEKLQKEFISNFRALINASELAFDDPIQYLIIVLKFNDYFSKHSNEIGDLDFTKNLKLFREREKLLEKMMLGKDKDHAQADRERLYIQNYIISVSLLPLIKGDFVTQLVDLQKFVIKFMEIKINENLVIDEKAQQKFQTELNLLSKCLDKFRVEHSKSNENLIQILRDIGDEVRTLAKKSSPPTSPNRNMFTDRFNTLSHTVSKSLSFNSLPRSLLTKSTESEASNMNDSAVKSVLEQAIENVENKYRNVTTLNTSL